MIVCSIPGIKGLVGISISQQDLDVLKKQFKKKLKNVSQFRQRTDRKIAIEKAKKINNLVMYDWKFVNSRSGDLADDVICYFVDSLGRIYAEEFRGDID